LGWELPTKLTKSKFPDWVQGRGGQGGEPLPTFELKVEEYPSTNARMKKRKREEKLVRRREIQKSTVTQPRCFQKTGGWGGRKEGPLKDMRNDTGERPQKT